MTTQNNNGGENNENNKPSPEANTEIPSSTATPGTSEVSGNEGNVSSGDTPAAETSSAPADTGSSAASAGTTEGDAKAASMDGSASSGKETVTFTASGAVSGKVDVEIGSTVGDALKKLGMTAPSNHSLRGSDGKAVQSSTAITGAMSVATTAKKSGG